MVLVTIREVCERGRAETTRRDERSEFKMVFSAVLCAMIFVHLFLYTQFIESSSSSRGAATACRFIFRRFMKASLSFHYILNA